jgi:hypothetical protein
MTKSFLPHSQPEQTDLPFNPIHLFSGFSRCPTRLPNITARSTFFSRFEGRMERRTPRYPCSANAEVTWEGLVELTRVTELSGMGATWRQPGRSLQARGLRSRYFMKAGYLKRRLPLCSSRPPLGMGVAFREVKSVFQKILEDWLQHSLDRQNKKPSIGDFDADYGGGPTYIVTSDGGRRTLVKRIHSGCFIIHDFEDRI